MVRKCNNCGADTTRFPVFKTVAGKKVFIKENWPNLFKMEWFHLLLFISIALIIFGYQDNIERCDQVIDDPCEYCMESGCLEFVTAQTKMIKQEVQWANTPLGINCT